MSEAVQSETPAYNRPPQFKALVDEFEEIRKKHDRIEDIITKLAELDIRTDSADPKKLKQEREALKKELHSAIADKDDYIRDNLSFMERLINRATLISPGLDDNDKLLLDDIKTKIREFSFDRHITEKFYENASPEKNSDDLPIHIRKGEWAARNLHKWILWILLNGQVEHQDALR